MSSLLTPAFEEIGPNSWVGTTDGWEDYPWPAGIILTTIMAMFLSHFGAQQYRERRKGYVEIYCFFAFTDHNSSNI
jgi:solute carrier family 39 (zinc transporter), member 1/2/3